MHHNILHSSPQHQSILKHTFTISIQIITLCRGDCKGRCLVPVTTAVNNSGQFFQNRTFHTKPEWLCLHLNHLIMQKLWKNQWSSPLTTHSSSAKHQRFWLNYHFKVQSAIFFFWKQEGESHTERLSLLRVGEKCEMEDKQNTGREMRSVNSGGRRFR